MKSKPAPTTIMPTHHSRRLILGLALALLANATHATPNFEGVWMVSEGGPPDANAQGAPGGPGEGTPNGGGGQGGPPPGAQPNAGPDLNVELSGTTLQCAPVEHLSVGGGGMSMLLVQDTHKVMLVSEFDMDISRTIYLDASHPSNLAPQPNGHSIGHWQGNTLIVDTIGYADKDGKDTGQHVTESFTRDGDLLIDQANVTDSTGKAAQRTVRYTMTPDVQFNENVCEEGAYRYQVVNGVLDNPNIPPEH